MENSSIHGLQNNARQSKLPLPFLARFYYCPTIWIFSLSLSSIRFLFVFFGTDIIEKWHRDSIEWYRWQKTVTIKQLKIRQSLHGAKFVLKPNTFNLLQQYRKQIEATKSIIKLKVGFFLLDISEQWESSVKNKHKALAVKIYKKKVLITSLNIPIQVMIERKTDNALNKLKIFLNPFEFYIYYNR